MSVHVMNRLRQRQILLAELNRALLTEPLPGSAPDTLIYRKRGGVRVIVNAVTGKIITVWRE